MKKNHDIIDIAGELRHETDKAFLLFDGDKEVWVPKSHGEWDPYNRVMQMPEWMALQKGLL